MSALILCSGTPWRRGERGGGTENEFAEKAWVNILNLMIANELTDTKTSRKPSKFSPSNCNCTWVTIPIWTCFPLSWKYLTYRVFLFFCARHCPKSYTQESSVGAVIPGLISQMWTRGGGGCLLPRRLHEVFTARKPAGPRAQSRAQTSTRILCLLSELCKVKEMRAFAVWLFMRAAHRTHVDVFI